MTDKELLKLAAKAAGFELVWGGEYFIGKDKVDCTDMPYIKSKDIDVLDCYWNPLTDDGDALRLAVKLKILIDCCSACAMSTQEDAGWFGGISTDQYAATRRAVVRCAAEIGKGMP